MQVNCGCKDPIFSVQTERMGEMRKYLFVTLHVSTEMAFRLVREEVAADQLIELHLGPGEGQFRAYCLPVQREWGKGIAYIRVFSVLLTTTAAPD